jgi:hypothetical protein
MQVTRDVVIPAEQTIVTKRNGAKYAVEMLPICKDAWERPCLVYNLAAVYAFTNEPSLAFEQLAILAETPGGIAYGELRLDPAWDPLREDPRFDRLIDRLASFE